MIRGSSEVRVNVIVPTYNHAPYIRAALDGILAQEADFRWDVTVLEDLSTDGTREIVESYRDLHPDRLFAVLATENGKYMPALARAIDSCGADYIALIEGDDKWTDPRKLQRQVQLLETHPDCALSFHNVEIWSEADGRTLGNSNSPEEPPFSDLEDLLKGNFIRTCSVMIRRESVVPLPEWFERMAFGDWPLFLLALRNGRAAYVPDLMACYRQHAGGMWSGIERRAKLEQYILFYDRIFGRLGKRYDETIRVMMVKRCYELIADRELGPGPAVPSAAPVREIEERLRASERATALRVTRVVPAWSPERLFGASIDIPKPGAGVDARSVDLEGWVVGKSSPVEAVELVRGDRTVARTRARLPRLDVAAVFPEVPDAKSCGFRLTVALPAREALSLNLIAVLRDESRVPAAEIDFGPVP